MLILQERDYSLLLLCFEQRFLVGDQIRRHFFQGNYSLARRRLRQLAENKLIRETYNSGLCRSSIVTLTSAGQRLAQAETEHVIRGSTRVGRATFLHDQIVTEVRIRLEHFWNAKFTPELAIKQSEFDAEVPDGVFKFQSGSRIALEVENSDKGKTRFHRLASRWSKHPDVLLVLYVASTSRIFRSIQGYLHQLDSSAQPLGLVLLDELCSGTPKIWTNRGELDLLSRKEL